MPGCVRRTMWRGITATRLELIYTTGAMPLLVFYLGGTVCITHPMSQIHAQQFMSRRLTHQTTIISASHNIPYFPVDSRQKPEVAQVIIVLFVTGGSLCLLQAYSHISNCKNLRAKHLVLVGTCTPFCSCLYSVRVGSVNKVRMGMRQGGILSPTVFNPCQRLKRASTRPWISQGGLYLRLLPSPGRLKDCGGVIQWGAT